MFAQPRHVNHQTPMHGRWLSVYVNKTAHDALVKLLAMPVAPEKVDLPDGAIVAKFNYCGPDAQPSPPWLTVMAKFDGYCQNAPDGACNGGDWFYYLSQFGAFLSFAELTGTDPNKPVTRESVFGQPRAFCTDCHNPVEATDFLWTLDAALWKTKPAFIASSMPDFKTEQPTAADLCADPGMTLSANLPSDVPLKPMGITDTTQRQAMFDCFSWQSFIALNWPADKAEHGQPAKDQPFHNQKPERVWESYKETFEVFQPSIKGWKIAGSVE